jgi:aminopeptidase
MPDPRTVRLARLIIQYSTRIGPGDRILLEAQPEAAPFVLALYREALEVGGVPEILLTLPGAQELLVAHGNDAQIDFVPTFRMLAYETFESRVRIYSESNTKSFNNLDNARFARRERTIGKIIETQIRRGAAGEFRWITTLFPTQAYAQDAGMSLAEFEDFVYRACHVDDATPDPVAYWEGVGREQQRVVAALRGRDRVSLRGPNADLTLSIKGRTFLNSCGRHNMPDGEVFTGPVEDSVNGWIRFTFPAVHEGHEVEGVELHFVDGRVTQATAARNQAYLLEMLDTDPGARYLGEFAIGNNIGIQRFTRQILFDEKIGGSVHVALGAGYPDTGSVNKSAIHWDMICDLKSGGEIAVDGDVIFKEGGFCLD